MKDQTQNSILQTLAYFELMEMPLAVAEIYEHLYWPYAEQLTHGDVRAEVDDLVNSRKIFFKDGFYSLSANLKEQIKVRKSRQARAMQWLKRSRPWLTLLASWPGVEAIAICNAVSWLQAKEDSDLDLLIITKPGQIWQTRFVLTAFLALFRKRIRVGKNEAEKFCLSFFVSSADIGLEKMAISPEDIYLSYWLKFLLPVYDPSQALQKLFSHNRHLASRVLRGRPKYHTPLWQVREKSARFRLARLIAAQGSWLPGPFENWSRKWQQKKFPDRIKELAKIESSNVVTTDAMLKFHVIDRREEFYKKWQSRCQKLNI